MSNALSNGVSDNLFNSSFSQFVSNFNTFRNNFQGDPKTQALAQAQSLLDSGRITKEQLQQIFQMASQLRSMIS